MYAFTLYPSVQVKLCEHLEKLSLQMSTSGLQTVRNTLINTSWRDFFGN